MANTFYTDCDREVLGSRTALDYRTEFQRDRDRVLYTSAFRRLQSKTQLFKSGEYDFYRTRLTHSLEVAQIGRGICSYLKQKDASLSEIFYIDEDLVEGCCLSHDIGHPPFGHAGERSLNRLMKDYGGFEGNAQTLRLVADTIFSDAGKRTGLSPTRAFLDSLLKYKVLWSDETKPEKHFLYADQAKYLDWAAKGDPMSVARTEKSIECQIMDWADDTAYCLGDLMDGVRAKFITLQSIGRWQEKNAELIGEGENWQALEGLQNALRNRSISQFVAMRYGPFIKAVSLELRPTNNMADLTNRYKFDLVVDPLRRSQYRLFHQLSIDLVFTTPQVHQLEFKGDLMIERLFKSLADHYWNPGRDDKTSFRLLPLETDAMLRAVPRSDSRLRARLICDHLSGMSDDFTVRTYKRMFDGGFGSLVDLV